MPAFILVVLLSIAITVLSYEINVYDFSADLALSGFLYKRSIIGHYTNLKSLMTCTALCGIHKECHAYSYNNKDKFCRIYKEIFCTTSDGDPYDNTFFYINPGRVGIVERVNMQCKITKQKTTELPSGKAIDGRWEVNFKDKSCSSTTKTDYPWWWVDLVYLYRVHSVVILNRGSLNYYHRLSKIQISVGMTLESLVHCGYREDPVPRHNTSEIACEPAPVKGRFIKIELNQKNVNLTMCEVAVNAEHVLN